MATSFLAYVVNFSGQLCFCRSYFFAILQRNYFDTITSSGKLFLQSSSIFEEFPCHSSQKLFFQDSYFFILKFLRSRHFLEIGSSLVQLLFGTATYLAQELFRTKISAVVLLFRIRDSAQHLLFLKSYIFEKGNFLEKQYSAVPPFPGELIF